MGYIGESCERDLDECATGLHSCNSSAYCVNMPGWYYCKCKPGYETHNFECHDINECYHGTHSCHPTATCVNYEGHFNCECPNDSNDGNGTDEHACRLSKWLPHSVISSFYHVHDNRDGHIFTQSVESNLKKKSFLNTNCYIHPFPSPPSPALRLYVRRHGNLRW